MKQLLITTIMLVFMAGPLPFSATPRAHAQQEKPGEYDVKAAFLFNFIKFTDWSDASSAEGAAMTLCVLGEDPFGSGLDALKGKIVKKGSELKLRHIRSVQEAKDCQVLFIGASEKDRLSQIIKAVQDSGILTIGDTKGFERHGVIINLYVVKDKVQFKINTVAAQRAGLQVSSRLLKLADIVED
jgi:hypothetical protein